jgi:hypothetical protein
LETAPLVNEEKEEIAVSNSSKKELKPLPDSLKYKFLGPVESLPVIIASNLKDAQEEELLGVLREHKEAIGWMTCKFYCTHNGIKPLGRIASTKCGIEPQRTECLLYKTNITLKSTLL